MRVTAALLLGLLIATPAISGDAEVSSAQSTIDRQLKAFQANDGATAYSYAAPNIKRMFPTVEAFMGLVTRGYAPVRNPRSYSFGKVEEMSPTSIVQQVILVGPDGKTYEAVYTLEMQADGTHLITGCSLRASNALTI